MVFTVALALVTLCIIAMLDRLEDFLHYKFENAATQTFQSRETRALEWLRFNFPFAPKQKGDATTYRHVFRRMMAGPRNRTRANCPRGHPRSDCTAC